jgi:hypothetical protein
MEAEFYMTILTCLILGSLGEWGYLSSLRHLSQSLPGKLVAFGKVSERNQNRSRVSMAREPKLMRRGLGG